MSPAWKPQLVALDIDGTLLDPRSQTISPAVRSAIQRVADAGSHVVLSTGRTMLGTLPVVQDLSLRSGVALCSNGAVKLDLASGKAVAVETFDPAPVYEALVEALPGAEFAGEQVGVGSIVTSPFSEYSLHGPQRVTSAQELISQPIPRLIAHWVGHEPDEVRAVLARLRLPTCTYTIGDYEPWVTVVPAGVTKGSALEKLRTELGVASSETFAAGDGDNDIEMLSWAACGVAMGQAREPVLAAANEVTAPVSEDGLATVLDRWFA